MTISAVAKTKVYIGTTTAASTKTAYEADTWVEVGEVEDLNEFGDAAEVISFASVGDSRVRKLKGARDAGTWEITAAFDANDAGQVALVNAANVDLDYNFKVVLNDKPDASGTPTTVYFRGLVMSHKTKLGQAKDVVKAVFSVGINSDLLVVNAAAGA